MNTLIGKGLSAHKTLVLIGSALALSALLSLPESAGALSEQNAKLCVATSMAEGAPQQPAALHGPKFTPDAHVAMHGQLVVGEKAIYLPISPYSCLTPNPPP